MKAVDQGVSRRRYIWQHYRATLGYVLLATAMVLGFWRQEVERNERSRAICRSQLAQAEILAQTAQAVGEGPSTPAEKEEQRIGLYVYRELSRRTLPPSCKDVRPPDVQFLIRDILSTLPTPTPSPEPSP